MVTLVKWSTLWSWVCTATEHPQISFFGAVGRAKKHDYTIVIVDSFILANLSSVIINNLISQDYMDVEIQMKICMPTPYKMNTNCETSHA